MIKRTTLRFWSDIILFLSVFGLILTGIIMVFFTDSGPNVLESSKYFLELHRHQWGGIHLYFAIGFSVMLVFHLILEWKWIMGKTRNLFKRAWVLIPVILIAGMMVYVGWLLTPKNLDFYQNHDRKWEGKHQMAKKSILSSGNMALNSADKKLRIDTRKTELKRLPQEKNLNRVDISGQDSFVSIESKTGISPDALIYVLKLPGDISQTERLGRFKRIYPFTINDVRDAINLLYEEGAGL
jgi:glucan phosphoethanolaminetransferase (alkaline phosphatase superfamily)